tara:strand:+ start:3464 stop:4918 length:1455 start_codon:yes stop_codon:yes gene_type:complete
LDISQYFSQNDLTGILPEITLLMGALLVLTVELFWSNQKRLMIWLGLAVLAGAGIIVIKNAGQATTLFNGMVVLDSYSAFFDLLYIAVSGVTLILSYHYFERQGDGMKGEFVSLILFSAIGMMLMTRANDLIIVFLGLELLSLSLYVLVGFFRHDVLSNESGVKYLLLGAFSTGFFLFGASLIYGSTGTTQFGEIANSISSGNVLSDILLMLGLGLLLVGFAFKVALVPFHMWSPDVYQGAPTSVTAFLCTAPKAAGFGALLKVLLIAFPEIHPHWQGLFWMIILLTMTIGNISALVQSNIKRMLAFSSIAHAGYLAMGILVLTKSGVSAVMLYLAVYSAMNLGSFAIISFFEKEGRGVSFSDYRGLAAKHPLMAAVLSLFMLALAGFPPTAGFVAKYAVFSSALEQGYVWLVVFAVLNSLVSVYYYIRIIVNMYMVEEEETIASHVTPMNAILLTFLAGIVILFGIYPSWLIDISIKAASVFS